MVAVRQNRFDFEWVRFLGAEPVEMADGRCVMRLRPKDVHLNHNGTVNAPILYGLAEVAGAGAVTAGMMDLLATAYVVVKRADIEYLAPAQDTVTAVGTVEPAAFAAAKAHMGGMAWYGDKIYVSAVGSTSTAIRVFSTTHILQMTDSTSAIGKTTGGYAAYGYKYAMMQVGYYTYAGGACDLSSDAGVPCFSSISLDRSTDPVSLVTTEYFSDQTLYGRLFRYGMGTDYLLGANSAGTVAATDAYRSHVVNMQGVLAHNGKWYVAHSSATLAGQLWTQTTSSSNSATCGSTSTRTCWATHPEGLTYDWSTGLVWSQSEWSTGDCGAASQTCGRAVFAVPLASLPS